MYAFLYLVVALALASFLCDVKFAIPIVTNHAAILPDRNTLVCSAVMLLVVVEK
jgi:hypothetical protein